MCSSRTRALTIESFTKLHSKSILKPTHNAQYRVVIVLISISKNTIYCNLNRTKAICLNLTTKYIFGAMKFDPGSLSLVVQIQN